MSWRFADCTLDPRTAELRRAGEPVHVERQVFQLLQLLIEQRDRLLTKDEIIERIWDGRAISDSALSSRIKSARAAIGDDGKAQRLIRTLHGQGFRFVGDVEEVQPAQASAPDAPAPAHAPDDPKPSIAVVPFRLIGVSVRGALSTAANCSLLPVGTASPLARHNYGACAGPLDGLAHPLGRNGQGVRAVAQYVAVNEVAQVLIVISSRGVDAAAGSGPEPQGPFLHARDLRGGKSAGIDRDGVYFPALQAEEFEAVRGVQSAAVGQDETFVW